MITSHLTQVNTFLSHVSPASKLTNPPESILNSNQKPKQVKLHSSDLPYLKILRWFQSKGRICYLTKAQWPIWLQKFGGKPIHYRKQKERWAKMRALGFITTRFTDGNRNKEMEHRITDVGILAVDNFKPPRSHIAKNGPSKIKKRPLEVKKTAPPLNHVQIQENKHARNQKKLLKQDPEKAQTYAYLKEVGFYAETALAMMEEYTRFDIYQAYNYTKEKCPRNPGAYMYKILTDLPKKNNKEEINGR